MWQIIRDRQVVTQFGQAECIVETVLTTESEEVVVGYLLALGERGGSVSPERAKELLEERKAYPPEYGDMCIAHNPTEDLRWVV